MICTYCRCTFSSSCWKWVAFDNPTTIDSILIWCAVQADLSTTLINSIHLKTCEPMLFSFRRSRFDCRTVERISRVRYLEVCECFNRVKAVIDHIFSLFLVTCSNFYHWLVRLDLTIDALNTDPNLRRLDMIFYFVQEVFQTFLTFDFSFSNVVINQVMIYRHLRWSHLVFLHTEIVILGGFCHNKRSRLDRHHTAVCLIEDKYFF